MMSKSVVAGLIRAVLRGIAIIAAALMLQGCNNGRHFEKAEFTGGNFQLTSASFKEKTPVFYSYMDGTKEIRFFVVKVEGQVYSYFDICNSCKQHNLGYRADDQSIQCRDCQVSIPYDDLKTGVGGCYPLPLNAKEENGVYWIPRSEIIMGRQFFP